MKQPYILIISGPTGVGKTAFVNELSQHISLEIINGDMGQLYTPLTIGTAKPDWQDDAIPHHLFDLLDQPFLFSSMKYRAQIELVVRDIWKKSKLPVIVGGSAFYLLSLFFPSVELASFSEGADEFDTASEENLWNKLNEIDPIRAAAIYPHDVYRIKRALAIWKSTGKKPSDFQPAYKPIAPALVVWLTRDRKELYGRINDRVKEMIAGGWIEEVEKLKKTPWASFLKKKKIIGYDLILEYLSKKTSREKLISSIQRKTRNYAKRQTTFWKSFQRKIKAAAQEQKEASFSPVILSEFNLTHTAIESYIKQLKNELKEGG